jgi:alpha,alpha-trehalose phosphorylase
MAVVYGVAGLRDWEGRISFHPRLPEKTFLLNFHLTVRGRLMEVDIREEGVTYALKEGEELIIEHRGEEITLRPGEAVSRSVASPGEAAARAAEEGGTSDGE